MHTKLILRIEHIMFRGEMIKKMVKKAVVRRPEDVEPKPGLKGRESRELFNPENAGTKLVTLVHFVVAPFSTTGEHTHSDREEINITLGGKGIVVVEGEKIKVEPGIFCYYPAGARHEVLNPYEEPFEGLTVYAPPGKLGTWVESIPAGKLSEERLKELLG